MDTKNITDFIVKGINEKKQSQQIIVVTHNHNIVVNTNSEQVIHMEFAGGEINASHSGALPAFELRDPICDVMEGGREGVWSCYYRITKTLEKKEKVTHIRIFKIFIDFCDRTAYNISEQRNLLDLSELLL